MRNILSLSIHDETIMAADILLNLALFPHDHTIVAGALLRLTAVNASGATEIINHDAPQVQIQNTSDSAELSSKVTKGLADQEMYDDGYPVDHRKGYYFLAKEVDIEHSSNLAGVQVNSLLLSTCMTKGLIFEQISMASQIAQAFGFKKGSLVLVSKVPSNGSFSIRSLSALPPNSVR